MKMNLKIAGTALALLSLAQGAPSAESADVGESGSSFNCQYDVTANAKFADPAFGAGGSASTNSVAECQALCDEQKGCVAASYDSAAGINGCTLSFLLGFKRLITKPTGPTGTSTVIQLKPNSCEKPVATPTPFACTNGRTTDPRTGCQFRVQCNKTINRRDFQFLRASPQKCQQKALTVLEDPNELIGFTWYKGGECDIITRAYGNPDVAIRDYKNGYTATLIPGSCN